MALNPYTIEGFGGLNLAADAFDVGASGAVAISNVDVDVRGSIRTRNGRGYLTSSDTATFSDDIRRLVSNISMSDQRVLALSATKLGIYTGAGSLYTAAITTAAGWPFADALPNGPTLDWVQDHTGLRQWDNGTHTLGAAVAGTPKGGHIGYAPRSSRIVIAGANSAGFNADRVNFLDPGAATFTSTNWVDLALGQERITGIATLGDDVWVWKESVAYIFYGESIDADGQPVFNYRTLNLGDRIIAGTSGVPCPPGRFSADGDAVYWIGSRGVWRSSGGPPVLVSAPISAVFRNEYTGALAGFNSAATFVTATPDRLYVGSFGFAATFVYEKSTGLWTMYAINSTAMAPRADPRTVYSVASARRVAESTPGHTTELGGALSWSYQSGRYPLSDPGRVAITTETSLVGSGDVAIVLDSDLYASQVGTVTLGTAPATAEGWPSPLDQEGTWLQYTLSGTGLATIDRITHYVSAVKPAGLR
jgi:hypothetical protein